MEPQTPTSCNHELHARGFHMKKLESVELSFFKHINSSVIISAEQ